MEVAAQGRGLLPWLSGAIDYMLIDTLLISQADTANIILYESNKGYTRSCGVHLNGGGKRINTPPTFKW